MGIDQLHLFPVTLPSSYALMTSNSGQCIRSSATVSTEARIWEIIVPAILTSHRSPPLSTSTMCNEDSFQRQVGYYFLVRKPLMALL
jgi:hypothetical protein